MPKYDFGAYACFHCKQPIPDSDKRRIERGGPYGYAHNIGTNVAIHLHAQCAVAFANGLLQENARTYGAEEARAAVAAEEEQDALEAEGDDGE